MSGVATPAIIVKPFGATAAPPYITTPIPVAAGAAGIASFNEGFPPATMTDPTAGGIPPSGADFNGIFYMLSAFCAMLQAGQGTAYSATASTAFTGYKIGARLRSVSAPGVVWTNLVDGNTADPDVDTTGWYASLPVWASTAPSAGAHNNFVLPVASDLVLDVDTSAGNMDFSGFVAQRDGQRLYVSNTGANLLTVDSLSVSSLTANRVRIPTDLAIVQNQTLTLQYSTGALKWLAV